MRSGPESTARYYLVDLRMFLKYLTDPRYGWGKVCVARSGVGLRELLGTR
jgi:hypothetical protein